MAPVFGFAFMPTKALEVNLVKGAIDHHGRYRVQSGISFYFDKAGATLKDLRRRYLEPNFGGPNSVGGSSEDGGRRVCIPRDGVQSLVSVIC